MSATLDYIALADAVIDRMVERGLITSKRERVTIKLKELAEESGVSPSTLRRRLESPNAPRRLEGKICVYEREAALKWAKRVKSC